MKIFEAWFAVNRRNSDRFETRSRYVGLWFTKEDGFNRQLSQSYLVRSEYNRKNEKQGDVLGEPNLIALVVVVVAVAVVVVVVVVV